MKRYNKYVVTGVQWIPEIPQHWSLGKVKYFYKMTTGFTPATKNSNYYDAEKGYDWVTIGDLKGRVIYNSTNKISSLAINDYSPTPTPKGSLMYSFKLSVGLVGFAGKELYTNEAIASFLEDSKTCLPYLYYAAPFFIEFNANTNIYGAHIMNQELIKNALIAFPPIDEQKAIANYLDEQCAKIDKVIAAQEKRVELLQELKQTIITRAVTRGIDPDVKLKDSGVEWIGFIPADWKVIRMRYLCDMVTGDKDTIMREENGEYPFYVRSPKVERINTYSFDGEAVLMAGDGVGAGKVIHYATGKFDFHQRVYNFHHFKNITGKYLYYYLVSNFKYKIEEGGAKNTVDSVRLPWLKDFQICVPTIKEQNLIISHIEKQSYRIDSAVSRVVHQIDLLKEYKQSLITEVVTGKRKVS